MLLPLGAGLAATALLLLISARLSPEWAGRKQISFARKGQFQVRDSDPAPLVLAGFSVVVGIPAALGLVFGNVFLLPAGLVATMNARRILSRAPESPDVDPAPQPELTDGRESSSSAKGNAGPVGGSPAVASNPIWWFIIFCWSLFAAALTARTFDLREILSAQAVLGPSALQPGTWRSVVVSLGFVAGVAAAAFWLSEGQSFGKSVHHTGGYTLLRWGEAGLLGSALSSVYFGPSLGAAVAGPGSDDLYAGTAGSMLVTCLVVGVVSGSRRIGHLPFSGPFKLLAAALALAAMSVAAFFR